MLFIVEYMLGFNTTFQFLKENTFMNILNFGALSLTSVSTPSPLIICSVYKLQEDEI